MPRKSKEKIELDDKILNKETEKKVKQKNEKKKSASKKISSKKSADIKAKKDNNLELKENKKESAKKDKKIKNESKPKKTESVVKSTKQPKLAKTKSSSKTKKAVSSSKSRKTVEIIEYYDLPYRYNQTIIKLLAQTPTSLFVYWDISDEDRKNFITLYGEKFFEETKPILLIHNETMNYTFEVEINDFANSWYLKVNDADCVYKIELGRKYYKKPSNISNDYIYITSSNDLESPNDRILFNNLSSVNFKNIKTNEKFEKNISSFKALKNIGKIYNIYDLYKKIYSEGNIDIFNLNNPSSGLTSSSFK